MFGQKVQAELWAGGTPYSQASRYFLSQLKGVSLVDSPRRRLGMPSEPGCGRIRQGGEESGQLPCAHVYLVLTILD